MANSDHPVGTVMMCWRFDAEAADNFDSRQTSNRPGAVWPYCCCCSWGCLCRCRRVGFLRRQYDAVDQRCVRHQYARDKIFEVQGADRRSFWTVVSGWFYENITTERKTKHDTAKGWTGVGLCLSLCCGYAHYIARSTKQHCGVIYIYRTVAALKVFEHAPHNQANTQQRRCWEYRFAYCWCFAYME